MTFDLSSDQQALLARARALAAEHITPAAEAIDRDGTIPEALRQTLERAQLVHAQTPAVDVAVVMEEWATSSAAVAAAMGLAYASDQTAWDGEADAQLPGLRGLGAIDAQLATLPPAGVSRARLVLAAVAVGIGRAAIEVTLAAMRAAGDRPGGNADERPHWVLADVATEVEAARLLMQKAAQAVDAGDGAAEVSLAKVFAAEVAERAVDAALRNLGPAGYRRGAVTERLTRDARAVALLGGTPEETRAFVADLTFPA